MSKFMPRSHYQTCSYYGFHYQTCPYYRFLYQTCPYYRSHYQTCSHLYYGFHYQTCPYYRFHYLTCPYYRFHYQTCHYYTDFLGYSFILNNNFKKCRAAILLKYEYLSLMLNNLWCSFTSTSLLSC
jgi:hypothetical protein